MTDILDMIASGEAAQAKEALNDMLASKAFEALDAKKQELAQALYGNNVSDEIEQEQEYEDTDYTEEE